ncbi:MAG TPA: hypothetical protein HA362_05700 [Nanoarchaeota archaeon]|nr:hypothetical protein [Nanoarchaeota archaeon]
MPQLEERLFHCLEANLRDRDEVIAQHGKHIDEMRAYSFGPVVTEALATALNIYRRNYFVNGRHDFVVPDDISPCSLFHTEVNISYYEKVYGLKTFMFAICIPEGKWGPLKAKMELESWAGAFYLPASRFYGFFHRPLLFSVYGLELVCNSHALYHEALHCDRRMYSANPLFMDSFNVNPDYARAELAAKLETGLVDEILCHLCDGRPKGSIKRLMTGKYMKRMFHNILQLYKDLKDGPLQKNREDTGRILSGIKSRTRAAVRASSYLRQRLPPEILVPLFYSLGPTMEEIAKKEFRPPFEDILLWAKLLDEDKLRPEAIRMQLQKRHYCAG